MKKKNGKSGLLAFTEKPHFQSCIDQSRFVYTRLGKPDGKRPNAAIKIANRNENVKRGIETSTTKLSAVQDTISVKKGSDAKRKFFSLEM